MPSVHHIHRRAIAALLATSVAVASVGMGLMSGSASAVVPDVINDPPSAGHTVTVFPARDFVHADGFTQGSLVDVEVWRNGVLAGFVNDVTPADLGDTPTFDGVIEVNHPGGACWTDSTPDIKAGDLVRFVEKSTDPVTGNPVAIAQQTTTRDVVVTTGVQLIAPDTIQVRGTAQDAAGNPLPFAEFNHVLVTSTADPFDVTGRRTLIASGAGGEYGTMAYDPNDPNGTTWVATYTGLGAPDIDRAMRAANTVSWFGPAAASTEGTIFELGELGGPQSPCLAPLAGPRTAVATSALFSASTVGVAAASAPTKTLTITNAGRAPLGDLHVASVTSTGDFTVTAQTCTSAGAIAIAGTCSVTVAFAATAAGSRSGSLTIVSDSVAGAAVVGFTGVGVAAGAPAAAFLHASPASLDFGTRQPLLTGPAQAAVVTNIGTSVATLAAPAIAGAHAADFSVATGGTCGATLAVDASCTVSLAFIAQAEGPRSAQLTVAATGGTSAAVALSGGGLLSTNVIEPPTAGLFQGAFIARDFVTFNGYDTTKTYTVQVVRHNFVVGATAPIAPLASGFFEVNHPGGACWAGVTPNIRGGDKLRVVDSDGVVTQSQVADVAITSAPTLTAPGVVEFKGHAVWIDGTPIPVTSLSAELTTSTANPFDLNGRRRLTAPGNGLVEYDPINSVTNPDGLNWTATFSGLSDADVVRTTQVAGAGIVWLGRDPGLASESTFYELGEVNGPQPPCAAPGAAPDADVSTAATLTLTSRKVPTIGEAVAAHQSLASVTVRSTGLIPLVINDITLLNPVNPAATTDFVWSPLATASHCRKGVAIPVGSECLVRIRFRPTAVGNRLADLQLWTNVVGTPTVIKVNAFGTLGLEPFASVNPLVRDFPERAVNVLSNQRIVVTNNGQAPLTVTASAVTGANAADFTVTTNTCSTSVAIGANCAITVRFKPLTVGQKSASVVLTPGPVSTQPPVTVALTGLSLTVDGFNDPPAAPRSIIAFPVRDFVSASGFQADDLVVVQVMRGTTMIGQTAPAVPFDNAATLGFDGMVEVNHVGGICWAGVTPDIRAGDRVRTIAYDQLGNVKVRNALFVKDQTVVQDLVVTQPAASTTPNTVVVKGYARDVLAPGQRLPIGSLEVRLVSTGKFLFALNGRRALRTGAGLEGTIAYDGVTDMWTATFTGLTPGDVAAATDGTTQSVGLWLGRDPAALTEGSQYEWGEAAGAQAPCDVDGSLHNVGVGSLTPARVGIPGEGGLLDLGTVASAAPSAAQTLTLTNTGRASMTVQSLRTDLGIDTNFAVAPAADMCTGRTLAVNATCTIGIRYVPPTPAVSGVRWGSLQVYSTGADSPHQAILRAEIVTPPTITSFTPASSARTTVVTLTGTNFIGLTGVQMVGTNALAGVGTTLNPPFIVASPTSLTFTVQAGAVIGGTYNIKVTAFGGTVTSATPLTVLADGPTITSFIVTACPTPAYGCVANATTASRWASPAGSTVTITGINLTGASTVTVGGKPSTSVTVVSATSVRFVVPVGASDGPVAITTASGTKGSATTCTAPATTAYNGCFDFYGLPTITAFSVNPARPGTAGIVLSGREFLGVTAMTINGTAITARVVNATGTTITFTLPAAATNGPLLITARGGIGTSNTFLVNASPAVTSFAPTSAGAGVGAVVTITGRNFVQVNDVSIGTLSVTFTVVSPTSIKFVVPAGAATNTITVRSAFGSGRSTANLTILARPTITTFTPLQAAGGVRVTVKGTGLNVGTTTTLLIGGKTVTTFTTRTATSLVFALPAGIVPGLYTITVTTAGGTAVSAGTFRAL